MAQTTSTTTNAKSRHVKNYGIIPVFGPVPGGMELAVIALILSLVLASFYHVYQDAKIMGAITSIRGRSA